MYTIDRGKQHDNQEKLRNEFYVNEFSHRDG